MNTFEFILHDIVQILHALLFKRHIQWLSRHQALEQYIMTAIGIIISEAGKTEADTFRRYDGSLPGNVVDNSVLVIISA